MCEIPLTKEFIRYYNKDLTVRLIIGITQSTYIEKQIKIDKTKYGPLSNVPYAIKINNIPYYNYVVVSYINPTIANQINKAKNHMQL